MAQHFCAQLCELAYLCLAAIDEIHLRWEFELVKIKIIGELKKGWFNWKKFGFYHCLLSRYHICYRHRSLILTTTTTTTKWFYPQQVLKDIPFLLHCNNKIKRTQIYFTNTVKPVHNDKPCGLEISGLCLDVVDIQRIGVPKYLFWLKICSLKIIVCYKETM